MQVSLKCLNCGAALTIPEGVDQMACGYCGVEQLVQREGGGVWLSLEKAINEVKATADRTAAEVKLRQLIEDHDRLAKRRDELEAAEAGSKVRTIGLTIMLAVIVIFASGFALFFYWIFVPVLADFGGFGTVVIVVVLSFLALMVAMPLIAIFRNRSQSDLSIGDRAGLDDAIAKLERQMEETRRHARGQSS